MKSKPPEPSDNWTCSTCGVDKIFTRQEMKEHLETVHKNTRLKGSSKMVLHLDAATHHISSFEINVGGVDLIRTTVTPRETIEERIARLNKSES